MRDYVPLDDGEDILLCLSVGVLDVLKVRFAASIPCKIISPARSTALPIRLEGAYETLMNRRNSANSYLGRLLVSDPRAQRS